MGGPEGKLRGRPPPPHCRAPDLGDGRGLNPSPDERKPAGGKYYSTHLAKTTVFANTKISAGSSGRAHAGGAARRTCSSADHIWPRARATTASGASSAAA